MLANPHSSLQTRHRQHRRQLSTPNALDAAKPPSLPTQALKRYHAHRRGQSLDQRAVQAQRAQPMRDASHHITNQAVTQTMPGDADPRRSHLGETSFANNSIPISAIPSCQPIPQDGLQTFSHRSFRDNSANRAYSSQNYVKMEDQTLESQPSNLQFDLMQQLQQLHSNKPECDTGLEGQFVETGAWDIYKHENISATLEQRTNAISTDMRRQSIQSDASVSHRPHTPKKINTHYVPITPATTPFNKSVDLAQYGGDMQPTPTKESSLATISPAQAAYMQRAKSLQGVAGTTFSQQKIEMPSPPNTASFAIESFDSFEYQQGSSFETSKSENLAQSHYSSSSSASPSFSSSPELVAMPNAEDGYEKTPKVPIYPATPSRTNSRKLLVTTPSSSSIKPRLSPRVASIDNLNLDARVHASIKQTGVTIDEIASYIHGPDPEDGKWVCLHPGCERRFGRKENIKSHVQTHLGDRQYKCDHCNKCFVRGHDLKRHAKIHTGDKPYECLCGNVFARHDALTRHRQRGMCVGGYKGIVRKATKRGRPKKHRPEMDERQDKAARTRQRIAEKSSTFDSSESDTSRNTSRNTPPSEIFENMSLHGSGSADEMLVFNNPNYLPPEVFTFTPPESPRYSMATRISPNVTPRSLTPSSEDEMLPLSPSKRPLESILEEHGLPLISDAGACSFSAASSTTTNVLSSPHTAPTLSDASHPSDLDIFISQEPSTGFEKHEFPDLTDPDMATFPDYVNASSFDSGLDILPGKSFSSGPSMGDDFFSFQFQVDEQPSDVMGREFFMD